MSEEAKKPLTTAVTLTDEELILLSGRCRPEVQRDVDRARLRIDASIHPLLAELPEGMRRFIVAARLAASAQGRLGFRGDHIRYCPVCQTTAGYALHKRSGREKGLFGGWHKKGSPNLDKPLDHYAVNLEPPQFIRFSGIAGDLGCCVECWKKIQPILLRYFEDQGVRAELPKAVTGVEPTLRWFRIRRCPRCAWTGGEHEMGRMSCLLGDGSYPAICPTCKFTHEPLGKPDFEVVEGKFVLVESDKVTFRC